MRKKENQSLDFEIVGGNKLSGSITTNYSKNGSVALLAASLLNHGQTTLYGIAHIEEVFRLIEVMRSIGVEIKWQKDGGLFIHPPEKLNLKSLDRAAAEKTRSAILFIGALVHRLPHFEMPHAGGCKMGNRTIAAHRYALENLGVKIKTEENFYAISNKKLIGREVVLYEASDTGAINTILAAAYAKGQTKISFAPPNYQVVEVCHFLEKLGLKIEGIGTTTLVVHGISPQNKSITYHNSEDPIESMMFLAAGVVTKSSLTIRRAPIDYLALELLKLEKMGLNFKISKPYLAENNHTKLVDISITPSNLKALDDKIHAQPYPGINSDNLPFFVPIATQAKGTTLIHDWMWENRAIYFTELNRLGAQVNLADPHRVFINGPTKLRGAQVVCPPALRPAMIILIAMLAAEGTSILRNIYTISRGYEEIAGRLNSIGANIKLI